MKREAKELSEIFLHSTTPSIDLFLARNRKYSQIGKRAIASLIYYAETKSRFREEMDADAEGQDWYSHLYHRMTESLTTPDSFTRFADNKITFITFNYDRSLEFFLYESLIHSFSEINLVKTKVKDLVPFPFYHVYGLLAPLPWENEDGIPYKQPELDPSRIDHMIDNIHVIYDERTIKNSSQIKAVISNAQRIFFLGFGYAKENLEILGLPDLIKGGQQVYGTAYKSTERELQRLKAKFYSVSKKANSGNGINKTQLRFENMDCYNLLREYL